MKSNIKKLYTYQNGDYNCSIYSDGTLIRVSESDNSKAIFPSSLDIKITDNCDLNCPMCHESSSINGKHADLNKLLDIIKVLPQGVELAVGGGNCLSHPDLISFLREIKNRGQIANLTVNIQHINKINQIIFHEKLIYGLGISITSSVILSEYILSIYGLNYLLSDSVVFHIIAGMHDEFLLDRLIKCFCNVYINSKMKILILGYKKRGKGEKFYNGYPKFIENNLRQLKEIILNKPTLDKYLGINQKKIANELRDNKIILAFDNLAIEQFELKKHFSEKQWNRLYMGNDGQFSMYIDAVNEQYALSSTSEQRTNFSESNLLDFFNNIKR